MARASFEDIKFFEDKGRVKAVFLRLYHFHIERESLSRIAPFKVAGGAIEFDCDDKRASRELQRLLAKGFDRLVYSPTGKRTVYVHRSSGIPIIGEGVFGLIDRNTNCIEVKPMTCCNLDCVFCSVDAGPSSSKGTDYVVELAYIIEEFSKLSARKEHPVEAHIGPQGEPLLYAPIVELVRELKATPKVAVVSIDTNGTMLTRKLIDDLAQAGLTRLNVSLQATEQALCEKLAGCAYNLKHVLEMISYAKTKFSVLLAPVIVPGHNDDALEPLIEHGLAIESKYPTLGIQNFLNYKRGRNPAKQRDWDEFYEMLAKLEAKKGAKLRLSKDDFGIVADAKLEKPFSKRDIVKAKLVCPGPEDDEMIASASGRAIIVGKAAHLKVGSPVRVEIIRDKHNVFRGVLR